ncbi:hypothetical protein [Chitinophaga sp. YIM B06452]|uniref:hypothetical protein n=1 Tax=Chitinophaga sp. YIM B06452 TaxID=3082158 RepID=UPI0031FEFC66
MTQYEKEVLSAEVAYHMTSYNSRVEDARKARLRADLSDNHYTKGVMNSLAAIFEREAQEQLELYNQKCALLEGSNIKGGLVVSAGGELIHKHL